MGKLLFFLPEQILQLKIEEQKLKQRRNNLVLSLEFSEFIDEEIILDEINDIDKQIVFLECQINRYCNDRITYENQKMILKKANEFDD